MTSTTSVRWSMRAPDGRFTTRRQVRLDATPLFNMLSSYTTDWTAASFAKICGVAPHSIIRWWENGITWQSADRVCCHLSLHISLVWGWDELDSKNREPVKSTFPLDRSKAREEQAA